MRNENSKPPDSAQEEFTGAVRAEIPPGEEGTGRRDAELKIERGINENSDLYMFAGVLPCAKHGQKSGSRGNKSLVQM